MCVPGRLCMYVCESVCKGLRGLQSSFHTQRREGWICFHQGPSNPWPQPRDQRVAQLHWIHSYKLSLDWPAVLWTSDLYCSFHSLLLIFFTLWVDITSIFVPNLDSLRGRFLMWANSHRAGERASTLRDIMENKLKIYTVKQERRIWKVNIIVDWG